MFTHHKLKVYHKALICAGSAERIPSGWARKHSFVDHFCRAAESLVLNIAEGLEFMRWISSLPGAEELCDRTYPQLDNAATSLLLNVAEGNGR